MVARKRFQNIKQAQNETIVAYYERLNRLRRICNIAPDDDTVKMAFIDGTKDPRIREYANSTAYGFTCHELVAMGTRFENESSNKATSEGVLAVERAPSTQSGTGEGFKGIMYGTSTGWVSYQEWRGKNRFGQGAGGGGPAGRSQTASAGPTADA